MNPVSKRSRLGGGALAILSATTCYTGAHAADAQTAPAAEAPAAEPVVVVTGSRIRTGAMESTPTTMVSVEKLNATTPTSVQDAVMKLPAFNISSATPNSSIASNGAGYNQPGNFLDLRGLGAIHTLVLQDGNRVPSTFFDGRVDTNMLPQMLMKRVDVVTGGVSAVYGSDAVAGVVNFITDTKFNGVKGIAQGGLSNYGDAGSFKTGIAVGTNVGERGHFVGSAEFYDRSAVSDTASRGFGRSGATVVGAGTSASPFNTLLNVNQSNVTSGGLAMTGPFAGQRFAPDGSLVAFNPGTATGTANLAVGGDGSRADHQYLLFKHRTAQGFARFDYDLTDDTHFYLQGRLTRNSDFGANQIYTNVSNASAANPTDAGGSYPLWIYRDNAFLSPAQRATLAGANVAGFALNRMDNDLMRQLGLDQQLKSGAITSGINGDVGHGDWRWDAHVTRGSNSNSYTTRNNVNAMKFYAATDAVVDPATGQTVCRVSLATPGAYPGCVPLNLLGAGRASDAAMAYVFDDTGYHASNGMSNVGVNVNGTLFEGWAGPLKFAAGWEFRHETLGMTPTVADNTFNPQYLRLGPDGNAAPGSYPGSNLAYFKEVPSGTSGKSNVSEKNVELNLPVLADKPFVKNLTLSTAYRVADYRVSGNEQYSNKFSSKTWKAGFDWAVANGLRLRGTTSKDFRAPTLWELYQARFVSAAGRIDPLTNVAGSINTVSGGNPNLRPEIGHNQTLGLVWQPASLRDLSLSFDVFNMKITDAIAGIDGFDPNAQRLCLGSDGSSPYCALIVRPLSYNSTAAGNFPTLIYSGLQNTAVQRSRGFDAEAGYHHGLGQYGDVTLRALWSRQNRLSSNAFPGIEAINIAGTIDAPKDKVNLSATYQKERFTFDVLQRYISKSRVDAGTGFVYTDPYVSAYYQTDVNLAYDIKVGAGSVTAFVNVSNVFNTTGELYQNHYWSGSPGMRYPSVAYADTIGRYFTVGARFKF